MHVFLRFIVLLSFLLPQQLPAQSTDSLARAIDSNSRAIAQSAKEIKRFQDSIEKARIFRNLEERGQPLNDFLKEMREQEEKRKRQVYIRIGLGALFLVVLIVGLTRRRRMKGK